MNKIEITSCNDCKCLAIHQDHTADSFELCFRYDCSHPIFKKPQNILRYIAWNEKINLNIPDWCPKLKVSSKIKYKENL